jgi:membrane-bound metal-dependent hydrolase YbcI (DUF457 family)
MDTITHGIAGALFGKGFFATPGDKTKTRVAIFAVTAGAVFPDSDFFAYGFSSDPLAIIKYHRGFTHSFLGLPLFAVSFALLTRWYTRKRAMDSPRTGFLVLAYSVGIASHIFLDLLTSWGTRLWNPLSRERGAWDVLFIIDLTFTGILLVPQVAAWICSDPEKAKGRGLRMWGIGCIAAGLIWALLYELEFPSRIATLLAVCAVLAVLFIAPSRTSLGREVTRAKWCRAGTYAMLIYIVVCAAAHQRALERVRIFAVGHGIVPERYAALPMPPSLWNWSGLIRTGDGVYVSHFDLREPGPPQFHFVTNSPPSEFTEEALRLKDVQTYLWFARFPIVHTIAADDRDVVEFGDARFRMARGRAPSPFTFQVIFNSDGKLLAERWLREDGSIRAERKAPEEFEPQ